MPLLSGLFLGRRYHRGLRARTRKRGAARERAPPLTYRSRMRCRSYANGAAGALRPTREICATGAASVMPPAAAPAQPRASARFGGHGSAVRDLRNTCFLLSTLVAGAFGDARQASHGRVSLLLAARMTCGGWLLTGRYYRRAGLCVARWVLAADRFRTERPARIKWIEIQRWPPFGVRNVNETLCTSASAASRVTQNSSCDEVNSSPRPVGALILSSVISSASSSSPDLFGTVPSSNSCNGLPLGLLGVRRGDAPSNRRVEVRTVGQRR